MAPLEGERVWNIYMSKQFLYPLLFIIIFSLCCCLYGIDFLHFLPMTKHSSHILLLLYPALWQRYSLLVVVNREWHVAPHPLQNLCYSALWLCNLSIQAMGNTSKTKGFKTLVPQAKTCRCKLRCALWEFPTITCPKVLSGEWLLAKSLYLYLICTTRFVHITLELKHSPFQA